MRTSGVGHSVRVVAAPAAPPRRRRGGRLRLDLAGSPLRSLLDPLWFRERWRSIFARMHGESETQTAAAGRGGCSLQTRGHSYRWLTR
eukprot:7389897-Prymnesium_polylepis.2